MQGPKAQEILQTLTAIDLPAIKYYWFAHGEIAGVRGTVSRTGYTGEDGFEVMVPPAMAARLWDALLQAGKPHGLIPSGLGARDTLRLEAAMRLYGNDIDETTTVLEADLGWIVGWNKPEFLGREVLHRRRPSGVAKMIVGFEMVDRAIARHGIRCPRRRAGRRGHQRHADAVSQEGDRHGLRAAGAKAPGTELEIDIRGRQAKAVVVPLAVLQTAEEIDESQAPIVNRDPYGYPADLKYTKEHEWVRIDGDTGTIGITDFAQQQLGDVVYVELPDVGATITAGQVFGTIESVKAVSELFAPVSGEVVETNGSLKDRPDASTASRTRPGW